MDAQIPGFLLRWSLAGDAISLLSNSLASGTMAERGKIICILFETTHSDFYNQCVQSPSVSLLSSKQA